VANWNRFAKADDTEIHATDHNASQ
jgi:hypothetical protein